MKIYVHEVLGIICTILISITLQAQPVTEIRHQVPLQRTFNSNDNCSGSAENIRITTQQYISFPKSRTQYYNEGTPSTGCSLRSITVGSCDEIIWEGEDIVNKVSIDDPMSSFLGQYTHCTSYIEVRPTQPGIHVYRFKLISTIHYTASNCEPASIVKYIFNGEITIEIAESAPKPNLVAQTKISLTDNTKEIVLLSVLPKPNFSVEWSVEGVPIGHELAIENPYDCSE